MSVFKLRPVYLKFTRFFCTEPLTKSSRAMIFHIKRNEHLTINHILGGKKNFNNEDWITIRKELCDSTLSVTERNIDSIIIDRCRAGSHHEAALSYVKFLKTTNHKLNIAVVGKYFNILYNNNHLLNDEQINMIFELYDGIRSTYSILDSKTAEACICALSMTNRWKECNELYKMIEFTGDSSSKACNALAEAAFNNNDSDIGWENLKVNSHLFRLNKKLYNSYLNYCLRNSKNSNDLENLIIKMFQFWLENDIHPDIEILDMFINCLKSVGEWSAHPSRIQSHGNCSRCNHKLSNVRITKDDFEHLSQVFLTKAIVGDDIYNNTTPEEFQDYLKFVASTKPYDVVIDGLNVAYALLNYKGKHNFEKELADVVRALVKENKKIFILGRKHMERWNGPGMNYVRKNSHIFLANDLTKDDLLLLHAAFTSGMNTFILSRDMMRQHKFILKDYETQRIFRHWQLTRQIVPQYVRVPHGNELVLIYPPTFVPFAQKKSNFEWHILYNETKNEKEITLLSRPTSWMCLRKKNQQA